VPSTAILRFRRALTLTSANKPYHAAPGGWCGVLCVHYSRRAQEWEFSYPAIVQLPRAAPDAPTRVVVAYTAAATSFTYTPGKVRAQTKPLAPTLSSHVVVCQGHSATFARIRAHRNQKAVGRFLFSCLSSRKLNVGLEHIVVKRG